MLGIDSYIKSIPSVIFWYSSLPSDDRGSKCWTSLSFAKLELIQSEKAIWKRDLPFKMKIIFNFMSKDFARRRLRIMLIKVDSYDFGKLAIISKQFKFAALDSLMVRQTCSSCRTEWVVPSLEASDIPPKVSRFSRLETAFLNVDEISFDFRSTQIWKSLKEWKNSSFFQENEKEGFLTVQLNFKSNSYL